MSSRVGKAYLLEDPRIDTLADAARVLQPGGYVACDPNGDGTTWSQDHVTSPLSAPIDDRATSRVVRRTTTIQIIKAGPMLALIAAS